MSRQAAVNGRRFVGARWLLAGLLLLSAPAAPLAAADERILDFRSTIDVYADATVKVREQITVRAERQQIKRGIYRDFPTRYRDRYGHRREVTFEIDEVLRNGQPEPWHSESRGDGVRVYIGRRDRILPAGDYTYTLTYRSDRQLGYFERHDELYWNVTGNDWAFPIDRAVADIRLPAAIAAESIQAEGYTGRRGAKEQDYRVEIDRDGGIHFETTRPFAAGEGLTVAVGWPKGHVHEPDLRERAGWLLRDNAGVAVGLAGLLLLCLYYLGGWLRVGRDPEAGIVYPRYEPPAGHSPASLRFVERMAYDAKTFTAALVNLAVKGWIDIEQRDRDWTLVRRPEAGQAPLAAGEQALLDKLFIPDRKVALTRSNHARIRAALKAHEASLRGDYQARFFVNNRAWLLPGWVISLAAFALALIVQPTGGELAGGLFMTVWLSGWSFGVYGLLRMLWAGFRRASEVTDYLLLLPLAAFSLPFVGGELFGLAMMAEFTSWGLMALLLLFVVVNVLFFEWMKAPTRAGRELLDAAAGLRLYLEVAEQEELDSRNPPDRTPELFERFLPYALALDVEQRWAERFNEVLFATVADGRGGYRPGWYHGDGFDVRTPSAFADSLGGALGGAVESSSSSSGSSSGMGGGGSSGGGGGGGGGGGW